MSFIENGVNYLDGTTTKRLQKDKTGVETVFVGGVAVTNFPATANFTTDIITFADFRGWTLSAWFPILNGGNPRPRITIEVSNSLDPNSFVDYNGLKNIRIPEYFEDNYFTPLYLRFKYRKTGVGAGSEITFNFIKNELQY